MKKILSVVLSFALILMLTSTAFAAITLHGDVDGNGEVNSADALLVLQFSIGLKKDINKTAADVTKDGQVNSSDALDILKICVGILPAFDVPTSKEGIVGLYNDALKSVYGQKKLTLEYTYAQKGEIKNKADKNDVTPYNDVDKATAAFANGVNEKTGLKIEVTNPGYVDVKGVASASVAKTADGYVVTVTLKEETTDLFKMPVYNLQSAYGFAYTTVSGAYTITGGTSRYTGTKLKLTLDTNGKAIAHEVSMPYECDYSMKNGSQTKACIDSGSTEYSAKFKY